jgi:hypothetical protein
MSEEEKERSKKKLKALMTGSTLDGAIEAGKSESLDRFTEVKKDARADLGRSFWGVFHPMLAAVHDPPTYKEKREIRHFLESMEVLYPCDECLPPDEPVLTGSGIKKIVDVLVGELVFTHRGRLRRVIQRFERPFQGDLVRFQTYGSNIPVSLTPNHPVLTSHSYFDHGARRFELLTLEWLDASALRVGDFVAFPRSAESLDREELDLSWDTTYVGRKNWHPIPSATERHRLCLPVGYDLMLVTGYYLAEGFVTNRGRYGPARVTWTFGKNLQEFMRASELAASLQNLGFKPLLKLTKYGWHVEISSVGFARFVSDEFGRGAKNKRVPSWVKRLPTEKLEPLLQSYLKGDGHHSTDEGGNPTERSSTVSMQLAYDLRDIGLKLGYTATASRQRQRTSCVIEGRRVRQAPFIYKNYFYNRANGHKLIPRDGSYVYLKVRKVERIPYQGSVYNLEVEEDNSYCHLSHALHNCRPAFGWVVENPPDFSSRKALMEYGCRFHNAIREHLDQEPYDCELLFRPAPSNTCSACSRPVPQEVSHEVDQAMEVSIRPDVLRDAMNADMEHRPLKDYRTQHMAKELVKAVAREYGVPPPRSIRFEENKEHCPGTSCTISNANDIIGSTKIFYNPDRFSLRTLFHEAWHYIAPILGPEKVKAMLGDAFKGDPDDEGEADQFAYHEIRRIFPELKLNSDTTALATNMQALEEVTVRRQGMGEIFDKTEMLYGPLAQTLKLPVSDLNLEYTPEIVGSIIEVLQDIGLTPSGQVIANLIEWIALSGGATLANVSTYDRQFLNEWGAHHLTRLFLLANPAYMSAVMGGAKSVGEAAGRGNIAGALGQLAKPPEVIAGGFRSAFASIQSTFAPFTGRRGGSESGGSGGANVPSDTTGGGQNPGQTFY